jgi:hypothetical protein
MDSLSSRTPAARWILLTVLVCSGFFLVDRARAQPPGSGSGSGQPPAGEGRAPGRSKPDAGGRDANSERGKSQTAAAAQAQPPRREPSQAYRDAIRKTLEKRRQRRARRAQGPGLNDTRPIGAIVPWPMPPALIIRHTPEVHGELDSLLGGLRR